MAYPGGHPRAYRGMNVCEVWGPGGMRYLPAWSRTPSPPARVRPANKDVGNGVPSLSKRTPAGTGKWNPCLWMASAVAISPHPAPRAMGRFPRCDRPCGHVLPVVNCPVSRLSNVPTCGPMLIGWARSLTAVLWAPRCEPEGPGASLPSRPHGLATCLSAWPHGPEDHQSAPSGQPRIRRPGDCPAWSVA